MRHYLAEDSMSQSGKSTKPKIRPSSERIKEITLELMKPENKVSKRLKKFKLFEKVAYIYLLAEDWPNPEKRSQRYQPRQVAAIIAWAEFEMEIYTNALDNQKKTKKILKNKLKRIEKRIEKIEKITNQKFSNLPSEVRISSFYGNEEIIGPYREATIKKDRAKIKKNLLIKSKTRPKQKPFDTFCLDMKNLFAERIENTPNYQLIADIANLLNFTPATQTSNTIRQRLYQLSK